MTRKVPKKDELESMAPNVEPAPAQTEVKKTPPGSRGVRFPISEHIRQAAIYGTTPAAVSVALAGTDKEELTQAEARKIINDFLKREV